jgi:sporulation protein YlmC with PRC-barrel domain
MEIEYGVVVVDKNGKELGKVDYIIMDTWSGEPRKYMVRRQDQDDAVFFTPDQVAEATKKNVKLNISADEIEQT